MKILKKETVIKMKQVEHLSNEKRLLERMSSQFITTLYKTFQDAHKLYMVLRFVPGGELFTHLRKAGKFPNDVAKFYLAEIVCALEHLHQHNIVYRDLKPENVLLDADGHIKLTDFGLSKDSITGHSLTHTFCGTPEYLAPEVIHGSGYGLSVDWWSLGTLLFEMLTGLPPFYNENLHVMYEKIVRAKLNFPSFLSDKAKSFLSQLLDRNPKTRLGGGDHDAVDVKKHPFFDTVDWTKLYYKEVDVPFKPHTNRTDSTDTTYVDDEFKREMPRDTPAQTNSSLGVNFPGFTYSGTK